MSLNSSYPGASGVVDLALALGRRDDPPPRVRGLGACGAANTGGADGRGWCHCGRREGVSIGDGVSSATSIGRSTWPPICGRRPRSCACSTSTVPRPTWIAHRGARPAPRGDWRARGGDPRSRRAIRLRPTRRHVFAAAVVSLLGVSAFVLRDGRGLRAGVFGASIVPVAVAQARGYATAPRRRQEALAEIRRNDQTLQRAAHGLGRLRGANVFLFLVESYGATVLDRPDLS